MQTTTIGNRYRFWRCISWYSKKIYWWSNACQCLRKLWVSSSPTANILLLCYANLGWCPIWRYFQVNRVKGAKLQQLVITGSQGGLIQFEATFETQTVEREVEQDITGNDPGRSCGTALQFGEITATLAMGGGAAALDTFALNEGMARLSLWRKRHWKTGTLSNASAWTVCQASRMAKTKSTLRILLLRTILTALLRNPWANTQIPKLSMQ